MQSNESNQDRKVVTVAKIYEALNTNNLAAYLSFFDEKVDRFESFGGRHHGLAELQANFSQGRDNWTEGSCMPENFTVVDNRVIAFVHVRVRLKNKTEWVDGNVIDVFTFKDERVIEFYSFLDRNEALKWAAEGSLV